MRDLERPLDNMGVLLFNADELAEVASSLQNGKIPRTDSIWIGSEGNSASLPSAISK